MKWLDNWLYGVIKRVHEKEEKESDIYTTSALKLSSNRVRKSPEPSHELNSRGVTFTMYSANGGTVIELRNYDEKSDRHHNVLHVIPSDKDIGEELGKIITYEALKR